LSFKLVKLINILHVFFTKVKGDGMVEEEIEKENPDKKESKERKKISVRMGKHGMRKIFSSIQVFRSKGSSLRVPPLT